MSGALPNPVPAGDPRAGGINPLLFALQRQMEACETGTDVQRVRSWLTEFARRETAMVWHLRPDLGPETVLEACQQGGEALSGMLGNGGLTPEHRQQMLDWATGPGPWGNQRETGARWQVLQALFRSQVRAWPHPWAEQVLGARVQGRLGEASVDRLLLDLRDVPGRVLKALAAAMAGRPFEDTLAGSLLLHRDLDETTARVVLDVLRPAGSDLSRLRQQVMSPMGQWPRTITATVLAELIRAPLLTPPAAQAAVMAAAAESHPDLVLRWLRGDRATAIGRLAAWGAPAEAALLQATRRDVRLEVTALLGPVRARRAEAAARAAARARVRADPDGTPDPRAVTPEPPVTGGGLGGR